jgi:CHAT domain-containing protein
VRSIEIGGKFYSALQHSEDEVMAIAGEFEQHGWPATTYLFEAATKEAFLETAGNFDVVHLATHSIRKPDSPEIAGILFSPSGVEDSAGGAVLHSGEAAGLRLDAQLVVLSACGTGLGRLAEGEGMLALTREFTVAGARSILYSLWNVYDSHSRTLMTQLYSGILEGTECSTALRRAKLELISNRDTAFPLVWAGFVLSGF